MKVVTDYTNFARGKIDHDLQGRFDLPIYFTGADEFKNFISNFKGNASYRYGFKNEQKFEDCALYPFRFSIDQNYILVFYNQKLRFLGFDSSNNFGWVLDGSSNIVELTTPYSLQESKELRLSRNGDVVYIAHESTRPRVLTRTSSNTFTINSLPRLNSDPFNSISKSISDVTNANPAVVTTSANHTLRNNDRVSISGVGGMTELNGNNYEISVLTDTTFELKGIDSTGYGSYTSGGTVSRAVNNPKNVLFYEGRLVFGASDLRPTTIWMSSVLDNTDFELPDTVLATSPLEITLTDTSQEIEWLFAGENSLIAGSSDTIIALNGGGVNTPLDAENIRASNTANPGCNGTYPIAKDGNIFYVSADGRNTYYFSYDLLTERFVSKDANILSYDVTKGGITKLGIRKTKDDLIFARKGNGNLLSLNFLQNEENIIGWHEHDTQGTFEDIVSVNDINGTQELVALVQRNGEYFIERLAQDVEFSLRSEFYTGDKAEDSLAYSRFLTEQLRTAIFLDNAIYYDDVQTETITFDPNALTVTAGGAVFSSGDVGKDIVYKTSTGYEYGRFKILSFTSSTVVEVEVTKQPHSNVYSSWYKTFSTVSGLSDYEGQEVTVSIDGAFSGTATVSSGEISLEKQAASVVIGYSYTGLIQSFQLGFRSSGTNTQVSNKVIKTAWIRLNVGASGKFGADRYSLTAVQKFPQGAINYSPLTPLDETVKIDYTDDAKADKFFTIVQDEPAPFNIGMVSIDASYGNSV
jgi:hypothetical protein